MSFKGFKPQDESMCDALAAWTVPAADISLFLGGGDDPLDKEDAFWWRKSGFDSPTDALLSKLKRPENRVDWTPRQRLRSLRKGTRPERLCRCG